MIDGPNIPIRNVRYNAHGSIDCEIEIVENEWIPFTATLNDVEPHSAQIYQRALAMQPVAYVAPTPVEGDYQIAVQSLIDATAAARNYTDGNSCVSYVGDTVNPQWAAEAAWFKDWRSQVWAYVFAQLALVTSGQRTQPTVAALISEITAKFPINWPQSAG
jgi:hypothetical protein